MDHRDSDRMAGLTQDEVARRREEFYAFLETMSRSGETDTASVRLESRIRMMRVMAHAVRAAAAASARG